MCIFCILKDIIGIWKCTEWKALRHAVSSANTYQFGSPQFIQLLSLNHQSEAESWDAFIWSCVRFTRRPYFVVKISIFTELRVKNMKLLGSCDRASWSNCEEREKTNKMQQSGVYYQLLSQHVSDIIMPIFRRTKTVLLHMVYCAGSAACGW